ncbi:hypothetical protein [Candidatus Amarolinea dominans]|uniref:hypothetical protein n=1 Tax=Candidatus Amarolinea dominans TaxID=3140696 RepID=UPI0031CCCABE
MSSEAGSSACSATLTTWAALGLTGSQGCTLGGQKPAWGAGVHCSGVRHLSRP